MNYRKIYESSSSRPKIGQKIKYQLDGMGDENIDYVFEVYDDGIRTLSDGMQHVIDIVDPVQDPMFVGLAQIYKEARDKGDDWETPYRKLEDYVDKNLRSEK
jgi:5-methylthioribose kinase